VVPPVIAGAGDQAGRRFLEFFAATIRNENTRMAYYRAVCDFFSWCDGHRIGGIADIEALHVAAYIENLQHAMSKPTVKQHLAAIRMQVVATNPAHSVRGPKHVVKTGKTTVLDADQARKLLDSIRITRTVTRPDGTIKEAPCVVGLRDRALISMMTFAFARIGAVVAMRVEDCYPKGKRWWVRLHEKGGKRHEMPAHHTLEAYLDAYIEAAGIRDGEKTPPLPLGCRPHWHAHGKVNGAGRCLAHDPAPRRRPRHSGPHRLLHFPTVWPPNAAWRAAIPSVFPRCSQCICRLPNWEHKLIAVLPNVPTRRRQRRAAAALRGQPLQGLADSYNVGRATISRLAV
jgi:site-specific recombinase XerD